MEEEGKACYCNLLHTLSLKHRDTTEYNLIKTDRSLWHSVTVKSVSK